MGEFNREGLGIAVDVPLPAERAIRNRGRIIERHGKPGTPRTKS